MTPLPVQRGYLWRKLRGGVWLYSMYGWTRATEKEAILWFKDRPMWHVEDHRGWLVKWLIENEPLVTGVVVTLLALALVGSAEL